MEESLHVHWKNIFLWNFMQKFFLYINFVFFLPYCVMFYTFKSSVCQLRRYFRSFFQFSPIISLIISDFNWVKNHSKKNLNLVDSKNLIRNKKAGNSNYLIFRKVPINCFNLKISLISLIFFRVICRNVGVLK